MSEAKFNYLIEGKGEPLLLVHGFGISFNIWRKVAPLLSPHFTLIKIQLPGIGGTLMATQGADYLQLCIEGLERVRESLDVEKWTVLGYSTGSRIAEAYVQASA